MRIGRAQELGRLPGRGHVPRAFGLIGSLSFQHRGLPLLLLQSPPRLQEDRGVTTTAPSAAVAAAAHARRGGESLRCGRAWASPSERTSERTWTSGGAGATVHLAGKDCTGVTADDHTARVYHAAVRPDRRVREKKGARCARVIQRHLAAPAAPGTSDRRVVPGAFLDPARPAYRIESAASACGGGSLGDLAKEGKYFISFPLTS